MTVECYAIACRHHSAHDSINGELDGPFCYEAECHKELLTLGAKATDVYGVDVWWNGITWSRVPGGADAQHS